MFPTQLKTLFEKMKNKYKTNYLHSCHEDDHRLILMSGAVSTLPILPVSQDKFNDLTLN